MPPSERFSLSISRCRPRASFFDMRSKVPSCDMVSSSFSRLMDCLTVLKFVSMPPSQRWSTNGIAQRSASSRTISRAERLVPTNRIAPRLAASWRTYLSASWYMTRVFSRLMMWILLRWPKMYGAIFGFQYRV